MSGAGAEFGNFEDQVKIGDMCLHQFGVDRGAAGHVGEADTAKQTDKTVEASQDDFRLWVAGNQWIDFLVGWMLEVCSEWVSG